MRTKAAWLLAAPYVVLARPTAALLLIGATTAALGLALRAWSAGTIDKEASLATTGPYAFTRNPLYLGSFVIGLGFAIAGGHWIWLVAFALFFLAAYRSAIGAEAERLTRRFGQRYVDYAAAVPALLPRLTAYRDPARDGSDFRWSRYRRNREWEALLGVVAAVAVLAARVRWTA